MSCAGCQAIIECANIDDGNLYSLEDQPLPYVLDCPDGNRCQSQTINLVCCGTTISATYPDGATDAQKQQILNNIANQCMRLQATCGEIGPQPPTTQNPQVFVWNTPQSCTVLCDDGTPFTYTVPAGLFAGKTLTEVNAKAKALACELAKVKKVCIPVNKLTTQLLVGGLYGFANIPTVTLAPADKAGATVVNWGYGGPASSGQLIWPIGQAVTISTVQIANTINVPFQRTRFNFYGWAYFNASNVLTFFNPGDPMPWTADPNFVGANPVAHFNFTSALFTLPPPPFFTLIGKWVTRYAMITWNFGSNRGPFQIIENAQDFWEGGNSLWAAANDGSQTPVIPGGWTRLSSLNAITPFWEYASNGSDLLGNYTHINPTTGAPIGDGNVVTISTGGFLI